MELCIKIIFFIVEYSIHTEIYSTQVNDVNRSNVKVCLFHYYNLWLN